MNVCWIYSVLARYASTTIDIATGSDGQTFLLEARPTSVFSNDQIAGVFTNDGHQRNEFKINNEHNVYCCLAYHLSTEQIVFDDFGRKRKRLKVVIYPKDGVFNRSVTRDKNFVCVLFTAVINDVASMFLFEIKKLLSYICYSCYKTRQLFTMFSKLRQRGAAPLCQVMLRLFLFIFVFNGQSSLDE